MQSMILEEQKSNTGMMANSKSEKYLKKIAKKAANCDTVTLTEKEHKVSAGIDDVWRSGKSVMENGK